MKVVILAGGAGTRITEESSIRPKPMIEIGHRPILWHIMKIYSTFGLNDFIVCCGYRGDIIKSYFANYVLSNSDVTVDLQKQEMHVHHSYAEPWRVTLVDTGDKSMTGGRIKRVQSHIGDEPFCMTYGDGVADVNIGELLAFHRTQNTFATLTAVQSPLRFGVFTLEKEANCYFHFSRETERGRCSDQRGFFCPRAPGIRLHRGGRNDLGAGAARTPCPGTTARRFSPRWILATHGYFAGQDGAGGYVGT